MTPVRHFYIDNLLGNSEGTSTFSTRRTMPSA